MFKKIAKVLFLLSLVLTGTDEVEARACPPGKRGRQCRLNKTNSPTTPAPTVPTPKPTQKFSEIGPPYDIIDIPVAVHVLYKDTRINKNSLRGETCTETAHLLEATSETIEEMLSDMLNVSDIGQFSEISQQKYYQYKQEISKQINWGNKVWGNVSEAAIVKQIQVLNDAFSGEEAVRNMKKDKAKTKRLLDSGFRFHLNSMNWYENSYFNDPSVDWWWLCTLSNRQRQIMDKIYKPGNFNIYICDASVTLGNAYLPWTVPNQYRGAMLHYVTLPGGIFKKYGQGKMAVHELGHGLGGLLHPYEGGCLEHLPSDEVDDTPRMKSNIRPNKCPSKKYDSCKNLPGKDPTSNYMTITPDKCRRNFTPGQVGRMVNVVDQYGPF